MVKSKKHTNQTNNAQSPPENSIEIKPNGIMDIDGSYPNPFTGNPATEYYKWMAKLTTTSKPWSEYQPWKEAASILNLIHNNQILLVIASTGVGKTVIIPKLLAHYFNYETPIVITIPRQKITEEAAIFAAKLMDVPIYQQDEKGNDIYDEHDRRIKTGMYYVGYRHGDQKKMNNRTTKLLFATDSTIKQIIIMKDHLLTAYGGIVIDEAHERSIHIDILIKLVFDIARQRPDFKIIIMSATVNKDTFVAYIARMGFAGKYAIYESIAPTQYKINVRPIAEMLAPKAILPMMFKTIKDLLMDRNSRRGDMLAFVTSDNEAIKLCNMINAEYDKYLPNWKPYACPISSKTIVEEQLIALEKNGLEIATAITGHIYHCKIICATTVAESSFTPKNDVVYVIESGLAYEKRWDAMNYVFNGGKNYITQANIKQRCGRTGRTTEGDCIQLYTELQYERFLKYPDPNITREDLTPEFINILNLPQVGGSLRKGLEFLRDMIEPVEHYRDKVVVAIRNMFDMDLLEYSATEMAQVSYLGKIVGGFNRFEMRSARMLLACYKLGIEEYGIIIAAILTVITTLKDLFFNKKKDKGVDFAIDKIMMKWAHPTGDHITILNIFIHWLNSKNRGKLCYENKFNQRTLKRIEKQYISCANLMKKIETVEYELLGIEGIVRRDKSIKISKSVSLHRRVDDKQHLSVAEVIKAGDDEDAIIDDDDINDIDEDDVQIGGSMIKTRKRQFSSRRRMTLRNNLEPIELEKHISTENIDKLLFCIAYGFNTNLGYYDSKANGYRILNSKYTIDIARDCILTKLKHKPKYIVYHYAIHQSDMNITEFELVSDVSNSIIEKILAVKKERTLRNVNIDMAAIRDNVVVPAAMSN